MNVTTMSYAGDLVIGMFVDPVAVDDPADLCACVEAAFQRLLATAQTPPTAS